MLAHLETVIASTAPFPSHLAVLAVLEMPVIDQRSHSVAGNGARWRPLGYGMPVRSAEAVHEVARGDAQHRGELEDVVLGGVCAVPARLDRGSSSADSTLVRAAPGSFRADDGAREPVHRTASSRSAPLTSMLRLPRRSGSSISRSIAAVACTAHHSSRRTDLHASIGAESAASIHAVTVAFTYRALVQQHLFHLDFSRSAKDVRVYSAYRGFGIRRVNILDYISSSPDAGLSRLPE